MNRIARFGLLLSLIVAGAAFAGWTKTAVAAEARFNGSGPGGFKIEGKTAELNVTDDGTTVTVVVQLANLDTGIALRDRHMRDKYLEVAKFPATTLKVPLASLKIPANGATGEGDAKGQFDLHGVTKEQAFHYKATCTAAGACDVEATMPLNMNDYGVKVPSYLGITVKPDLTITTRFQAKRP